MLNLSDPDQIVNYNNKQLDCFTAEDQVSQLAFPIRNPTVAQCRCSDTTHLESSHSENLKNLQ